MTTPYLTERFPRREQRAAEIRNYCRGGYDSRFKRTTHELQRAFRRAKAWGDPRSCEEFNEAEAKAKALLSLGEGLQEAAGMTRRAHLKLDQELAETYHG